MVLFSTKTKHILHSYKCTLRYNDTLNDASLNLHFSQLCLQRADVICATCIGSGSDMLSKYAFHTVLIDECTQATETAVLVPISRGCQQLILVGDHCQLPPTVISDVAMEKGLAVSLFSRLADQKVQPVLSGPLLP